jgi:hypothetical protein
MDLHSCTYFSAPFNETTSVAHSAIMQGAYLLAVPRHILSANCDHCISCCKSVAVIRGNAVILPCNIHVWFSVVHDSLCVGHEKIISEHSYVMCQRTFWRKFPGVWATHRNSIQNQYSKNNWHVNRHETKMLSINRRKFDNIVARLENLPCFLSTLGKKGEY